MSKWTKYVKAKITSFFTSDTSSSLLHFFRMLDSSYSLNVLKSECWSTWHCSWIFTVYLFLLNLKWFVIHHINPYKSCLLISNFFQLKIKKSFCTHFHPVSEVKANKKWKWYSPDHMCFYKVWHIRSFIHPSLDVIYDFCLDASENRLWYTHVQLYFGL